jgi:hypothetical protein
VFFTFPGRRGQTVDAIDPSEVVWGVKRRSGFGDLDDPSAHAGLTMHAFPVGNSSRAICGYRPLSTFTRRLVALAAVTEYNAPCRECASLAPGDPLSVSRLFEIVAPLPMSPVPVEPALVPVMVEAPVAIRGRSRARNGGRRQPVSKAA